MALSARSGRTEMLGRSRSKDTPVWSDAEVLIAESGAFLCGWAPDLFIGRGLPVPSWAWLNPAVHQGFEAITLQARAAEAGDIRWGTWEWVTGSIACLLVEMTREDPVEVERIQRERLLPLELSLISDDHVPVTSPSHLLALALESLRGRPIVQRRLS
jgi:hypothetical protein